MSCWMLCGVDIEQKTPTWRRNSCFLHVSHHCNSKQDLSNTKNVISSNILFDCEDVAVQAASQGHFEDSSYM